MTTPSPRLCSRCGKAFLFVPIMWDGKEIFRGRVLCEECHAAQESENLRQRREQERLERLRRWREICPSAYGQSNPTRLPEIPLKDVLAWKERREGRGLLLVGPPRVGKTRSIWLLLHRLFIEGGVPVVALADTEFAHECGFRFANNISREWIQRLCTVRVFFLDDLGRATPTERYRHELFHVIEQRTAWNRPLLVTTNFHGEELANRIGDTVGIAIVERLREFCQIICFDHPDNFHQPSTQETS